MVTPSELSQYLLNASLGITIVAREVEETGIDHGLTNTDLEKLALTSLAIVGSLRVFAKNSPTVGAIERDCIEKVFAVMSDYLAPLHWDEKKSG